ncbi:NAD(P)/FAD-dependent oxidoreductase [Streptomyces sp. NPDC087917]|uniref:phytoene desaturase family protein n=1 Tax=unclassified Streptomyces TaxID=2593676 RepID=UPI003448925A
MAGIAVIGAGMGAMATAARLAVAGHRVTVYERGSTYGGAVGRYERDGFVFDTGPGVLHLPAVYRDLFVKTGRGPLEDHVDLVQLDPAVRHVLHGTSVTLPGASRGGVAAALDEAFGAGAGERWNTVLGRARDTWDATRRPLLEEPLRPDWRELGRDPYPAPRGSGLLRRRPPTLAETARRELGGGLGELLSERVRSYGLDPDSAPASAAALPYMEQTFGSWYPRGGMRELATAVYERCLERKVTFLFDTPVREVLSREGRAAGVVLADGTTADADSVVCGIDPRLLPARRAGLRDGVPARGREEPGRITLLLALRGARPDDAVHRTLVHSSGPAVTVLRPDDPATRPDADHEAVTVSAVCGPAGGAPVPDPEALLDLAARAVPELRKRLLWEEVRTPEDVEAATGALGGSVPPPALAGAGGRLLYPANATALPGLYLAGGWAHPGGGLAHAGMSGALVAGLIVEGAEFRGSR